jgi:hypothetical protein
LQIAHLTDINITGVQLEAGTTASDFEFLPVDVNLADVRYRKIREVDVCMEFNLNDYLEFSRNECVMVALLTVQNWLYTSGSELSSYTDTFHEFQQLVAVLNSSNGTTLL